MFRKSGIQTRSPLETRRIAQEILRMFLTKKTGPIILALRGDLGSGKTTFVQGIAKSLGIRERVQSPTFVLMKWYDLAKRFRPYHSLIHVDAYRLTSARDAARLGLGAILRDRTSIIVIEWADRIRKLIPKSAVWVIFRHAGKEQRFIEFPGSNIKFRNTFNGKGPK